MEKENIRLSKGEQKVFEQLIIEAKNGDLKALEEIIELLDKEIEYLSNFINMPREDALQSLKVEVIELINKKNL